MTGGNFAHRNSKNTCDCWVVWCGSPSRAEEVRLPKILHIVRTSRRTSRFAANRHDGPLDAHIRPTAQDSYRQRRRWGAAAPARKRAGRSSKNCSSFITIATAA